MGIWHYGSALVYWLVATLRVSILLVLSLSIGYAATVESRDYQQLIMQAETIPTLIEDKVLTKFQIPNPHWRKDGCLACHVSEPDGAASPLKASSDGSCYFCHSAEDHVAIHPVNLAPGKKMLARMPKTFKKNLARDGKINCITCHDALLPGVRKKTVSSQYNRSFLRGGIYRSRTGICYRCHDKGSYKKLNPHDQINAKGVLNEDRCLICHRDVPKQKADGSSTKVTLQTDSNWSEICLNCHKWQPHPGGNMTIFSAGKPPNHLVVPPDKIRNRMVTMSKKNNLDLPLEPGTGEVYCATCHNPHERGVIKKVSLAKGADEKSRLRSKKICLNCHDK